MNKILFHSIDLLLADLPYRPYRSFGWLFTKTKRQRKREREKQTNKHTMEKIQNGVLKSNHPASQAKKYFTWTYGIDIDAIALRPLSLNLIYHTFKPFFFFLSRWITRNVKIKFSAAWYVLPVTIRRATTTQWCLWFWSILHLNACTHRAAA